MITNNSCRILYLSTEIVPYARTGGLAQVASALPRALRRLGDDVRVMIPCYGLIDPHKRGFKRILESFPVPHENDVELAGLWQAPDPDLPVYFIEHDRLFGSRTGIYSFPDDGERFVFYSRACLEAARHLGWQPHIVHCNEWQTALVPNWLRTIYAADPFFAKTAVVYNIHNLSYQGIFGHRVLEMAGIENFGFIAHPDVSTSLNEVVSMVARGIIFADVIVTVSPTYAKEILTPEFGEGLDPILRDRQNRLYGILNAIDISDYDPRRDPNLTTCYDSDHTGDRNHCKTGLQNEAGLPSQLHVPIISLTSRLNDQKGYDILSTVLEPLLRFVPAQWVIMGTGEQRYHDYLLDMQERYPQKLRVFLTYSESLSRRIFAGSDIFLMPSRHEPCGLDQMVAMRYGALPVVHATGGLTDTVKNHHPPTTGTGFVFDHYDGMALFAAIVRAVEIYDHHELWSGIRRQAMSQDLSWERPAHAYRDLYRRAWALKFTGLPG